MMLNQTTNKILQLVWTQGVWKMYGSMPRNFCDEYGACGPNGKCDMTESPNVCECLRGYRPKSPEEWIRTNYEGGCLRDKTLNCESDGFIKYVKMKLPDTENCWYLNQSMNLVECRDKCLRNCSCMAYANSDIRGEGNGCALWFGDLNDLRVQPDAGQDLYVRVCLIPGDLGLSVDDEWEREESSELTWSGGNRTLVTSEDGRRGGWPPARTLRRSSQSPYGKWQN
ncbi:S-locus-specific glycoprotein S13-like [Arachis hypogaea]|uniref:S-locus-specific glycoprotein S13-like n=1 Tax=Arachis hypogaea TaxID=3818 RepID=UPI0011056F8C|nr:G-type lectin S-receptor-like serine/threonine-protein kinase At4g27290 [Arachis hypogaea]